jgi:hypothetical protein
MGFIDNILFLLLLGIATWLFSKNVMKVRRNILLGKDVQRNDQPGKRMEMLIRVALGQSKMVVRPVAGIMHLLVYIGFVIINIEVIEIMIDGLFGTHRVLSFTGGLYDFLIASFEWLALGGYCRLCGFSCPQKHRSPEAFSFERTEWLAQKRCQPHSHH